MVTAKYDNHDGRLRGAKAVARRLRVWTKSPWCAMCGCLTFYTPDGFHIDHRIPLHKAGPDTEDNLQTLCIPCHDKKTALDMGYTERVEFDNQGRVKW